MPAFRMKMMQEARPEHEQMKKITTRKPPMVCMFVYGGRYEVMFLMWFDLVHSRDHACRPNWLTGNMTTFAFWWPPNKNSRLLVLGLWFYMASIHFTHASSIFFPKKSGLGIHVCEWFEHKPVFWRAKSYRVRYANSQLQTAIAGVGTCQGMARRLVNSGGSELKISSLYKDYFIVNPKWDTSKNMMLFGQVRWTRNSSEFVKVRDVTMMFWSFLLGWLSWHWHSTNSFRLFGDAKMAEHRYLS